MNLGNVTEWVGASRRILGGALAIAGGVAAIANGEPPSAEETAVLGESLGTVITAGFAFVGGLLPIVSRLFPKRGATDPELTVLPAVLRR
jgi:hypothetical protein